MKICDLVYAYNRNSGGIKTYVNEKRRYIEERTGHRHILIMPEHADACIVTGRHATYHIASPVVPRNEPYRLLYRLDKIMSILNAEQPDIIEIDSAYTLPWAALTYRHFHPCRIFGYYHSDFPSTYVRPYVSRKLGVLWGKRAEDLMARYARYIYGRCDATVASSRIFGDKLRTWGVRNILEIPLGVDLGTFHPGRRDEGLRRSIGAAPPDPVFVYSGRVNKEKRTALLCESFARLPRNLNAHLAIIGDGPQKAELEGKWGMRGGFHFLPYQENKERLANFLASCDIFATACPFETFGLAVTEAQACGLASVGVRGGALLERIPAGLGFLAGVDSPESLASEMARMLAADYRAMGAAARIHAERYYSWNATFDALFSAYHSSAMGRFDHSLPNLEALSAG